MNNMKHFLFYETVNNTKRLKGSSTHKNVGGSLCACHAIVDIMHEKR